MHASRYLEYRALPPPEKDRKRVRPVPHDEVQVAEGESCQVGEMSDTRPWVDQLGDDLDPSVDDHERRCAHGQDPQHEYPGVREKAREGKHDGENGAGGAKHLRVRQPHGHEKKRCNDPGAYSAEKVEEQELGAAHALFELYSEHEKGQHVEKQVGPPGVEEHVRDDLPPRAVLKDRGRLEQEDCRHSPSVGIEAEKEDENVDDDEDDRRVVEAVAERTAKEAFHD